MEVDLGPGHIVLDAVPALRERGTAAPSFWPMSIVAMVTDLSCCWALVVYSVIVMQNLYIVKTNCLGYLGS